VRDDHFCLPARLVWHAAHYTGARVPYAAPVLLLKTLHILGAVLLLGGVTNQVLLRTMAARAQPLAQKALSDLAWRVQITMVYVGSGLVLISGIVLWIAERFNGLFTGWLLLGFILYAAAAGLDGALLAPSLRRARAATAGEGAQAVAALVTVQLIAWLLLLIVLFLMVTRPF
jgi:uncharacterized membrane protein